MCIMYYITTYMYNLSPCIFAEEEVLFNANSAKQVCFDK